MGPHRQTTLIADTAPHAGGSSAASIAAVHLGFVLTGIVTTLLGPILPVLSADWSLRDVQAGNFFLAQFAGSMAGVALSGAFVFRRGVRQSLVIGYVLMAAGVAALGCGIFSLGLPAVFCYGLGQGITIPSSNLTISDRNPHAREAALNVLNFAWGVGAVACPFVVSMAVRAHVALSWLFGLGFALAFTAVAIHLIPANGFEPETAPVKTAASAAVNIRYDRFFFVVAALFFIYVGTETALGGWVAAYAKRIGGSGNTQWALAPACFWGALLAGRALAPVVLRTMTVRKLAVVVLAIATCGIGLLVVAQTVPSVLLGVALAGLGCASVFPINVGLLSHFGCASARVASTMFFLGGLGGAVLPWLVGVCSTRFSSLKVGLLVPLTGAVLLLILHSWNAWREEQSEYLNRVS